MKETKMTKKQAKCLCTVMKWPWPLPQDTTKGKAKYYTFTQSDDLRIAKLETQIAAVKEQLLLMPQSGSGYDYWIRQLYKALE